AAQMIAQADVCDPATRQVDPNRLALYALAKAGVSNYPYRWLANAPRTEGEKRTIEVRLLAADDFCGPKPAVGADGIKQCADDDRDKLGYAMDFVTKGLDAHDFVLPAGLGSRRVLFGDTPPAIACRISTDGSFPKPEPTVIAAPLDFDKLPLRIRGSTDGLQFRRKLDAAFNGVDKASVSFKSDRAAGKDTTKAAIVVAFAVPLKPDVLEFVPYFGFSTDTAKKDGADKDVTTDIIRAGALIDFRTHGTNWAHLFLVRPEYAADRKARSEVVSG
ncbi:MAG: hypothetical protein GY736_00400, partial [Sphingomonas sp.]|uniref:hypothetical protein n=1 Tax=Sphingomonas sp. TaxID=28214 RepID=UPI002584D9FA